MLGLPESAAHAREAIIVAARVGDDGAQARGYLALQLALGLRGDYPQAVEAADEARRRLTALGADVALRCLDVQLAQTHQIGGNLAAAAAAGQRALAGLGPGERWLHGHVLIVSALALYRLPGRQTECARAAGEALRAMRDLSNPIGEACALDVLGWLAADAGRMPARRLAARRGADAVAAGRRQAERQRPSWRDTTSGPPTPPPARSAPTGTRSCTPGARACRSIRSSSSPSRAGTPCPAARGPEWCHCPGGRSSVCRSRELPAMTSCGARSGRPDAEELTGREREIAALVALGLPNRDIAARLFISRRTVDAHINHIFAKLGLSSRVQLANWARDRLGELPASTPSPTATSPTALSRSALSRSALPPSAHA